MQSGDIEPRSVPHIRFPHSLLTEWLSISVRQSKHGQNASQCTGDTRSCSTLGSSGFTGSATVSPRQKLLDSDCYKVASRHSQHLRDIFSAGPPLVSAPNIWTLIGCHLLALGVCRQPQGVIVRGQGGGGAGVPGLRAGAQRRGEVQPEINRVTNLTKNRI